MFFTDLLPNETQPIPPNQAAANIESHGIGSRKFELSGLTALAMVYQSGSASPTQPTELLLLLLARHLRQAYLVAKRCNLGFNTL